MLEFLFFCTDDVQPWSFPFYLIFSSMSGGSNQHLLLLTGLQLMGKMLLLGIIMWSNFLHFTIRSSSERCLHCIKHDRMVLKYRLCLENPYHFLVHTKREKKNKENNKYGLHGSKQCRAAAEDVFNSVCRFGKRDTIECNQTHPSLPD